MSSPSLSSAKDDEDNAARSRRVIGQAKWRVERSIRREDRIHSLETTASAGSSSMSDAMDAELAGLLISRRCDDDVVFEERYNPTLFDLGHVELKRMHNEAFVALAR
jgi:hypothetical protein